MSLMSDQPPPQRKLSPGAAIFLTGVLALIGLYLMAVSTESTAECRSRAMVPLAVLLISFFVLPVCGLQALVVGWLDKRGCWPRWCRARLILIAGILLPPLGFFIGLIRSSPQARYAAHVGILEDRVSDIQVFGFNALLASHWFFAFSVMPDDAALIASTLELQEDKSTDLKQFLTNDTLLLDSPVSAALHAANPGDLKTYSRTQHEDLFSHWIILTVDASHHRAWLYRGFHN